MRDSTKNVRMTVCCPCGEIVKSFSDILLTDDEEVLLIGTCGACGKSVGTLEKLTNMLMQCPSDTTQN